MVSTRTTAQGQREVQRLDCSVPGLWLSWLLVVHIVRPLGVALVLYWKQRAWRGQGAAVAGVCDGPNSSTVRSILSKISSSFSSITLLTNAGSPIGTPTHMIPYPTMFPVFPPGDDEL